MRLTVPLPSQWRCQGCLIFLTIPYLTTAKAFTRDLKFFEFASSNTDTYFQFDSTIKTYDFVTNAANDYFTS
jgi:hypothetical protein